MPKKIRTNLGAVKEQRSRSRARRVNGDETLIPNVVPVPAERIYPREGAVRDVCSKCDRAGRYMLIHGEQEHWLCMEHYFGF
jgi:hypothetical protein